MQIAAQNLQIPEVNFCVFYFLHYQFQNKEQNPPDFQVMNRKKYSHKIFA